MQIGCKFHDLMLPKRMCSMSLSIKREIDAVPFTWGQSLTCSVNSVLQILGSFKRWCVLLDKVPLVRLALQYGAGTSCRDCVELAALARVLLTRATKIAGIAGVPMPHEREVRAQNWFLGAMLPSPGRCHCGRVLSDCTRSSKASVMYEHPLLCYWLGVVPYTQDTALGCSHL